ncbi:MAG: hypothetical protein RSB70_04545 [Clostridium sp.]
MKNGVIKKVAMTLFISTLFMCCSFKGVLAMESEVVYENDSNKVVTLPGDDLFQNFKDVYPNSVIEQSIKIKNENKDTIKLYLRAEPADEKSFETKELQNVSEELIKMLSLTLNLKSPGLEDKVIYSGPASGITSDKSGEIGSMTSNILLGEFKKDSSGEIIATLSVPENLGNKYENSAAKVKWIFSCDVQKDISNNIVTGDRWPMVLNLAVSIISGVVILLVIVKRKNSKKA